LANSKTIEKATEAKKTFEDKKFLAELENIYKDLRFTIKKVQHKNDNITAYMYETDSRILSVDSSAMCPIYCDDNTIGRDNTRCLKRRSGQSAIMATICLPIMSW